LTLYTNVAASAHVRKWHRAVIFGDAANGGSCLGVNGPASATETTVVHLLK